MRRLGVAVLQYGSGKIGRATWLAAAGLLAAAQLLVTGCAAATSNSSAPVKLTNAEIAVLINFGLTGLPAAQVNNAYQTLVQRCMQSKGLVYYPLLQTAADDTVPHPELPGIPQAYIGLAAREADGYGFYSRAVQAATHSPGSDQAGGTDAEGRYIASLPAAAQKKYSLALYGPDSQRVMVTFPGGGTASLPKAGCAGAVERRMYGSTANYLQATTGVSIQTNQLFSAVEADPSFPVVVARWSSCMAKHGYHYHNPEALWNKLATRIDTSPTPAAHALEIKVSVADYKCAAKVKLVDTVQALEDRHARYLGKALAQNLALISQIYAKALKAAKALNLPS